MSLPEAGNNETSRPRVTFLKDYRPPDYLVTDVDLRFELDDPVTRVTARLAVRRNGEDVTGRPLVLQGSDLKLLSVALDDEPLAEDSYHVDAESLTIVDVPASFNLTIETAIQPAANTSLNGLYKSGGNFCTQCEAEGFRRITYFPDRPDVLAVYSTTIIADREMYPVLLSNGNAVDRGQLDNNRHWVTWRDPFPKPSYLFALVAGDLGCVEDEIITLSGRRVKLEIFVQRHNLDKCAHALESLKKAMKWDEEVFGREYDLDTYMIVAVDDFNMGAMENKGLNIFNSSCVLARPETATDADFQSIEGIVGHEYFHNWSGNRVTCRDWFQLSLKEGFTVFRDQEFSADMHSRGVKRIQDVNLLRTHQFREDAGPLAHPVRPDSYVEINNFYTTTVYNKGAEVVRMLYNLLGKEGFRKGTDLYFERHDGQAVTTDDFIRALEDANQVDFTQFRRWYSQAGTPELTIVTDYDEKQARYKVEISQKCSPTPGQPEKQPFHIPFALGLLDKQGNEMALRLAGEEQAVQGTRVLSICEPSQTFEFIDVHECPEPSFLRGFSAPVRLKTDLKDADFYFLARHDQDEFNCWEAFQTLAVRRVLHLVERPGEDVPKQFIEAFDHVLSHPQRDQALIAQALRLPSEAYISEFMDVVDPQAIHDACRTVRACIARHLEQSLSECYERCQDHGPYQADAESIGRRSLKNLCLAYLTELATGPIRALVRRQFENAKNMTDAIAALGCLANMDCEERTEALSAFYEQWEEDALVINKWLAIQATSRLPDTLDQVRALKEHTAFHISNPNNVRALIGGFCHSNPVNFHRADGEGYAFLADNVLELNALNPQIAARLVSALTQWRRYDEQRQGLMKTQLERIAAEPNLSRDVYEIVSRSLEA
jgi:aminopeptidase N